MHISRTEDTSYKSIFNKLSKIKCYNPFMYIAQMTHHFTLRITSLYVIPQPTWGPPASSTRRWGCRRPSGRRWRGGRRWRHIGRLPLGVVGSCGHLGGSRPQVEAVPEGYTSTTLQAHVVLAIIQCLHHHPSSVPLPAVSVLDEHSAAYGELGQVAGIATVGQHPTAVTGDLTFTFTQSRAPVPVNHQVVASGGDAITQLAASCHLGRGLINVTEGSV